MSSVPLIRVISRRRARFRDKPLITGRWTDSQLESIPRARRSTTRLTWAAATKTTPWVWPSNQRTDACHREHLLQQLPGIPRCVLQHRGLARWLRHAASGDRARCAREQSLERLLARGRLARCRRDRRIADAEACRLGARRGNRRHEEEKGVPRRTPFSICSCARGRSAPNDAPRRTAQRMFEHVTFVTIALEHSPLLAVIVSATLLSPKRQVKVPLAPDATGKVPIPGSTMVQA